MVANFQNWYGDYPDLSAVKKILIIKMRHHGDVLLTSPLFHILKKALPSACIDAYVYKDTLPMLEGHPDIDHYIVYDRKWKSLGFLQRFLKEVHLLRQIRNSGYDMVINLTEGDRGAMVARTSKARYRVGYDIAGKAKRKTYTHLVKLPATPRHTVEQHLDVARRLGIFPGPDEKKLSFHIPQSAIDNIKSLLQHEKIDKYILIHPVSRWLFKCPPPANIAEWIKKLHAEEKKIIISAGPDKKEMSMVEQILSHAPNIPVCNLAGKISLKELGALIQLSECLICVDSVPLHIASALKKPAAVVFGPSVEAIWGPWMNPQSKVITRNIPCRPCGLDGCGGSKMSDCLASIPAEAVIEGVKFCLAQFAL